LTVWLDLGKSLHPTNQTPEWSLRMENERVSERLAQANDVIRRLVQKVPTYQFLTAIPQLISRICHPNPEVQDTLELIIVTVLNAYPQQTLWHLMAVAKSNVQARVQRVTSILNKARSRVNLFNAEKLHKYCNENRECRTAIYTAFDFIKLSDA
jgi:serine/threonine-protein kinase ATR